MFSLSSFGGVKKFDFTKWCGKIFLRFHNAFSSVPTQTINDFFIYELLKLNTKTKEDIEEQNMCHPQPKETQGHRVLIMGDTYKMQLQYSKLNK